MIMRAGLELVARQGESTWVLLFLDFSRAILFHGEMNFMQ